MLQVENLKKYFGNTIALDGISFEIKKGEVVGFLGPNGAGKTTALRIISGFLSANDGDVFVDGLKVGDEPLAIKSKIGYLPEQPPLYPEMYVKDYLNFVAGIKGVDKKDIAEFVEDAMDAVMIKDKADKIIRNLSKGYKQRVGLAGALVHKPQLLLLDEPTVGLDPNQIIEIRKLINNLKAEDRTLIISSHILAEVEQICDKVVIINKGQIAAIDTREALTKDAAGQSKIMIEVAREPEGASKKLESLEGVSVSMKEGNSLTLSVSSDSISSDKDMREKISKCIVDGGMGLISMNVQKIALEDIFIKLTRDEELDTANIDGGKSNE